MTPEQEALDFLQSGIEFAYQQGLHEVGYDPVALIRAALSQAEADRVDAERYRFIRAHSRGDLFAMGVDLSWYSEQEGLDAAIDAARKASTSA